MSHECRTNEDLVPGAEFCAECFRYKTKEHQCPDFRYGRARLIKQVETSTGKKKWQVKREDKK